MITGGQTLTLRRSLLLPFKISFSRVLALLLTAGALAINIACVVNVLGLINKPFGGFLLNQRLVFLAAGSPYWTGPQAGLNYPDRILTANGQAISSLTDLQEILKQTKIGDYVTYTFDRRGQVVELKIPTMKFTWAELFTTFGIPFLSGLIYLILGAVVFIMKRDTDVSWAHLLLCICLSLYGTTSPDYTLPPQINLFVHGMLPGAFLHLSLLFPERWKVIDERPALQFLPYLISLGIAVPLVMVYPAPQFVLIYELGFLYLLVGIVTFMASTIRASFTKSVLARQRAKVILFGSAVAFPIPGFGIYLSLFGNQLTGVTIQGNLLEIPLILFPASIAYAITKHNLFDVDVYIKRAVGYALMTIIVATGYLSIQLVLRKFVLDPLFGAQAENVYPVVFALLVVFFFNPINRKVQENVDKLFFRKQYDYKAAVAKVTDALTTTVEIPDIIRRTIGTLRREMFVDNAGVVLMDERKRECESLFLADGPTKHEEIEKDLCLEYEDPLLKLLAEEKKLITKYDIAEDPRYAPVRDACGQRFVAMGASVAVPLFSHDQVTGVLALGYKKSGHFYNREDIDLLKTVSSMTSTAIEQAREKGEKQMVMQLFSKHVSPEVAEAVWNEREQFLEGGRPRSQKLMVTVLFTDLKGFSTLSEKTDPQALMDWLNIYMDTIAKCVMDHGGVVDDYFGDGMKANFGVPLPRTTDAEIRQDAMNAVNCALAMEKDMGRLNSQMHSDGLPSLKMRVGIHTGLVVAGSLGSSDRMKYTTVGDTVNTASRLESFDKDLVLPHLENSPCRIIISESTAGHLGSEFETVAVGELGLKGKLDRIRAYCVLCKISPISAIPAKD